MCGGFDDAARTAPQPQGFPVPPPDFDFLFRNPATPESTEVPEEEMVEEVFEDGKLNFSIVFLNVIKCVNLQYKIIIKSSV